MKAKKEIELLDNEITEQRKIVTAFEKLQKETKIDMQQMDRQKEDAARKIHKSNSDLKNTENDLAKKKEAIRDNDANIQILEQGGKVEDQATLLEKTLNAAKNDLKTILAQIKSISDEIRRTERDIGQNQQELT